MELKTSLSGFWAFPCGACGTLKVKRSRLLSLTKSEAKSFIVVNKEQSQVVNKIRAKPKHWLICIAIDVYSNIRQSHSTTGAKAKHYFTSMETFCTWKLMRKEK